MAIGEKLKALPGSRGPETLNDLFRPFREAKEKAKPKEKTLDELFQSSKEGILLERVKSAVNTLLPEMRQGIAQQVRTELTDEIRRQIRAIKVRDGVDGKSPDPQEIIKRVLSKIPTPKDGRPGKDAKFNKDELVAEILNKMPRAKRGGGGSTMRCDNLSSQANGATRTFTTTHNIGSAHLLFYSSFPTFFLPTTDYTVSGTTVTLSSSIDPPVAGQSLAFFYESAD